MKTIGKNGKIKYHRSFQEHPKIILGNGSMNLMPPRDKDVFLFPDGTVWGPSIMKGYVNVLFSLT